MIDPISLHHSFVVRCWRDANGLLRGWVVDALTQRSYPFALGAEIGARIESLVQDSLQETPTQMDEQERNEDS